MSLNISIKAMIKVFLYLFKEKLFHPFSYGRTVTAHSEPNLIYGLTDHPIDIHGDAITSPFNLIKKLFSRKALVIREIVQLKRHSGNVVEFECRAVNLFLNFTSSEGLENYADLPKLGNKTFELTLKIEFLLPGMYRLMCAIGDSVPEHDTEMVINDVPNDSFSLNVEETDEKYVLKTPSLRLELFKKSFRIKIYDHARKLITESSGMSKNDFTSAFDSFPLGFIKIKKNKRMYGTESFVLYPGEAVYGLGEHYSRLNKVGQTISLWNTEGCGNSSPRNYKNIPFFLSTRGYGVFVNESRPITFWVGTREFCKNMVAIEGDLIDYYFIFGPDFKSILFSYTGLTGRSPVPPKWSFGAWMSRISYKSEEEVISVAKRLRDEKYPMDVIHIDTNWFERDWECDWKFSKERFPDPEGMCRKMDKMGFKISLWQSPYIVNTLKEYKEAKEKKIVGKNHGPFLFLVTFPSVPIDFSNPEGVKWYQEKLVNLFKIGISVIKTDFGEAIEPHQEFLNYNGREMHNLYPLLYQKAAFEATKEFHGKGIIWARSAYAGSQRYPVHWSGDSSSQFEEMLNVLRGGLSLGMCGFTYWSQDVGGFIISPTDKLYIRWTQFSIFNSHIRYHGNPPRYREPWNYSNETQRITREFLNLRYRLIPYIYSEARYASDRGLPMLAPMVLEFQDDPTTFNIEDQFMFGRYLLIAPILTREDEERQVYLPRGKWYDFWSLEQHTGPAWINCESQIDKVPIFIRDGAILPMGPIMQFVDEKELNSIDLIITSVVSEKLDYVIAMDDDQDISVSIEHDQDLLAIEISRDIEEIVVNAPAISGIKEIKVNGRILSLKKNKERIIAS